jgi:uncharacterized protein
MSGGYRRGRCVLTVKVAAPPVDGAANDAVCQAVATAFGVRPSSVELVRGHTSRRKRLQITGDADALQRRADELRSS